MSIVELGGAGIAPVEVGLQNFQAEVLEKSQSVPVVAEFYAEGAEPSEAMSSLLKQVLPRYEGKLQWARIDVQRNPQIVQQLGVRGLPTLKIIHQGQLAGNLEGPQTEESLAATLDPLFLSPLEQIKAHLESLIAAGDLASAIDALKQMIQQEPNNTALFVELADLMIQAGDLNSAAEILAGLATDTPGRAKPDQRLVIAQRVLELPSQAELEAQISDARTSEDRMTARLSLAFRLAANQEVELALDQLLENLREDRLWQDEISRHTMLGFFDLFDKGHPTPSAYRRKLFTLMH
jgi:putative thioredoxin